MANQTCCRAINPEKSVIHTYLNVSNSVTSFIFSSKNISVSYFSRNAPIFHKPPFNVCLCAVRVHPNRNTNPFIADNNFNEYLFGK